MNIVVVAHDPRWRARFEAEADEISQALASVVTEIHHIGSTAVPGIYAKPVIDILVEAISVERIDEYADALAVVGYESLGEFGIPGRRYFRKDGPSGNREYQVHAFARHSSEAQRHLAFRDFLRSHPDVAQEYSELKRSLAKQTPFDVEAHMNGKDPFIKATERAALRWWRCA